MQRPSAAGSRLIDAANLTFENADELILLGQISNPKSEVMCKCGQVNFHINWERFIKVSNGAECLASPEAAAPKHGEHHFRIGAHANFLPIRGELTVRHMVEKVRVTRPVDAMEMKCQDIGAFRFCSFNLAFIQVWDQREMIVFGEIHEIEMARMRPQKFGSRLKQSSIALKFALMVARSQARIVSKEFLFVRDGIELTCWSAIREQDVFVGDALLPMSQHSRDVARRLMGKDQVQNGVHSKCILRIPQVFFVLIFPGFTPFLR